MTSLDLERQAAGEAPVFDEAAVAALRQDNARVLARLPAKTTAARILAEAKRPSPEQPGLPASFFFVPAFLAASVVVLVVLAPGGSGDRVKGLDAPALLVSKQDKVSSSTTSLISGDHAKRGDVVQLSIRAVQGHGVVVSVDGKGEVTRHFPEPGAPDTVPRGTTALPFSFELDDAPRYERFFFVVSDEVVDVGAVEEAAKATFLAKDPRTAPLKVAPRTTWTDFLLVKE